MQTPVDLPAAPIDLVATPADLSSLTAAYAAGANVPLDEIEGTLPGSVYLAQLPSTGVSWAMATFSPTSTASLHTQVSMQDGRAIGIFTMQPGGAWSLVAFGSVPFCPSETVIPSAVQSLWALPDAGACSVQG